MSENIMDSASFQEAMYERAAQKKIIEEAEARIKDLDVLLSLGLQHQVENKYKHPELGTFKLYPEGFSKRTDHEELKRLLVLKGTPVSVVNDCFDKATTETPRQSYIRCTPPRAGKGK